MSKPSPPYDPPVGTTYSVPTNLAGRSANCCATVREFVVIGGLNSTGTAEPYAIRWCDIGDPTTWSAPDTDAARAAQAGQQSFPTRYGQVTAIAGNDFYMYVFQVKAISKGTYIGGDTVWSFDIFEEDRGCIAPGMMAQIDDMVFFESERGRHLLQNDVIIDIGYGITDDSY